LYIVGPQMPDHPILGTYRAPPRSAVPVSIFLKCRKCGPQNCFTDVPVTRVDLAMFRGSEERVKCRGCGASVDTMGAYVGARAGGEIARRPDPEY
jgi:hypothetical protein